jgi:hypothetical protein
VPDISLGAAFLHEGFLTCVSNQSPADCTNGFRDANNNLDAVGGTSAGTPAFAGMVVLLNQKTGSSQGNVNPQLYTLAAASTDAFHDITAGDNMVPCQQGSPNCPASAPFQFGYSALGGYDRASGLGSVDSYNLVSELATHTTSTAAPPDFTMTPNGTATLNVTHGTSGNFTVIIGGTPSSGTVTFTCIVPTTLAGVTCTPPGPVASGNAVFTITASSTARLAAPGRSRTFLAWNWGGGFLIGGVLLGAAAQKKRGLRSLFLFGALLLLALAMLAGCGGGSSGTVNPPPPPPPNFTPESGTVVLQGVSNADVHIVPLTVNVN